MITDFSKLVLETARAFHIDPTEITGHCRKKNPSMARHVVMALWADDHAFQDAADRCRRRCHNTAMFASAKVFARAQLDESFARMVAEISRRCQYGAEPEEKTKEIEICA